MENKIFIKKETMKGIADAIRAKDGTTEEIAVTDMAERIGAIGGINYLDYCQACTFASLNLFGAKKVEITLPQGRHLNNMFASSYETWDEYEAAANTTVEELIIHCPNRITGI